MHASCDPNTAANTSDQRVPQRKLSLYLFSYLVPTIRSHMVQTRREERQSSATQTSPHTHTQHSNKQQPQPHAPSTCPGQALYLARWRILRRLRFKRRWRFFFHLARMLERESRHTCEHGETNRARQSLPGIAALQRRCVRVAMHYHRPNETPKHPQRAALTLMIERLSEVVRVSEQREHTRAELCGCVHQIGELNK